MFNKSNKRKSVLLILPCEPLSSKNIEIIHDSISGGRFVFVGIRDDYDAKYSALEIVGKAMDIFDTHIKAKKISVIVVPNVSTIEFLNSQRYEYC